MKLIIDIPEKVITAIQNGEDYRYDIHTAIAQGIPYEEKPKGDCISREALKEALQYKSECIDCSDECCTSCFYDIIDNAPTVEPFEPDYVGAERVKARQRGYTEGYHFGMKIGKNLNPQIKQGEWIKVKEEIMSVDTVTIYKCSKCERVIATFPSKLAKYYPFCHCGADMRKGGAE